VLPVTTVVSYAIAGLAAPEIFHAALDYGKRFLWEMVQVFPSVVVLSGLIAVWVPRDLIVRSLGTESGWKGRLLSIVLGSVSAGPIYAAFPLCTTLNRKGASTANIVTIISAWAVIKVPMLLMEIRFLGLKFAALRYVLTVPAILGIAFLMERLTPNYREQADTSEGTVLETLPGHNCKACGYATCAELAASVECGEGEIDRCVFLSA
jgi:uncharacterized membrane protein YraQ (UPF0718 family)